MKKGIPGMIFLVLFFCGLMLFGVDPVKKKCTDIPCKGANYCADEIVEWITCTYVFCKDQSSIQCEMPNR